MRIPIAFDGVTVGLKVVDCVIGIGFGCLYHSIQDNYGGKVGLYQYMDQGFADMMMSACPH